MTKATISPQGYVFIPKAVRERLILLFAAGEICGLHGGQLRVKGAHAHLGRIERVFAQTRRPFVAE